MSGATKSRRKLKRTGILIRFAASHVIKHETPIDLSAMIFLSRRSVYQCFGEFGGGPSNAISTTGSGCVGQPFIRALYEKTLRTDSAVKKYFRDLASDDLHCADAEPHVVG